MTKLIDLRGASPPTVVEGMAGKVNRLFNMAYADYTQVLLDDRVRTTQRGLFNRGVDTFDKVPVFPFSHHGFNHAGNSRRIADANDSAEEQSPEQWIAFRNAWIHDPSGDRPVEALRDNLRENVIGLRKTFQDWFTSIAASVGLDHPTCVILTHVDSGMRVRISEKADRELLPVAIVRKKSGQLPVVKALAGDWTETKNQLRCELVDKEIDGTLSPEEVVELEQLQKEMLAYRRKMAPLPLQEVRELHQALLEKARRQNDV